MFLKSMFVALSLVFSVTVTQAQPARAPVAQKPMAPNPGVKLREGMDGLIRFMRQSPRPDRARIMAYLDAEIAPFFDFEYMGKSAAGQAYQHLNKVQRAKLTKQIKENFLTTMARRLASYNNQKVRYLAHRVSADQRTAVAGVAIMSPGNYPARLDFRFYKSNQGWKVFDVMANGQSTIVYYRRQFRQMLAPKPQYRSYSPGYPYYR
ncbi:MAG: MlaC/ttg2D family ABC transporter substrate-binding protein [bacterium]